MKELELISGLESKADVEAWVVCLGSVAVALVSAAWTVFA